MLGLRHTGNQESPEVRVICGEVLVSGIENSENTTGKCKSFFQLDRYPP